MEDTGGGGGVRVEQRGGKEGMREVKGEGVRHQPEAEFSRT